MVPPEVCEKDLAGNRIAIISRMMVNSFFILMVDLNSVQKSATDVTGVLKTGYDKMTLMLHDCNSKSCM